MPATIISVMKNTIFSILLSLLLYGCSGSNRTPEEYGYKVMKVPAESRTLNSEYAESITGRQVDVRPPAEGVITYRSI